MIRKLSDIELDCVSGGGGGKKNFSANTRRCKPEPKKVKCPPPPCPPPPCIPKPPCSTPV
jgi:hypothetical protein